MNKKISFLLGITFGLAALFGCASSTDSAAYTGTWAASFNAIASPATSFGMTLYQSGSNFTGDITITLTIPAGETVNSQTVTTAGTLSGTLALNGTTVTGTLTGTINSSQAATATISLTQSK
jgi:hypothetical protein